MTLSGAADLVRMQQQNRALVGELQQKVADQERVMKLFQRYVPADVVADVLRDGDPDEAAMFRKKSSPHREGTDLWHPCHGANDARGDQWLRHPKEMRQRPQIQWLQC
jgi:ketosteroid isomerase-like protein